MDSTQDRVAVMDQSKLDQVSKSETDYDTRLSKLEFAIGVLLNMHGPTFMEKLRADYAKLRSNSV